MRVNRWVGGLVAAGVATGALVVGTGTAFADAPPPSTAAAAAGPATQRTCTDRIPALLARIDKVTARITGDAATRGSTAWLKDKESKARAAGDGALADLLDARVAHRQDRLDQLAAAKRTVQDIQQKDCSS